MIHKFCFCVTEKTKAVYWLLNKETETVYAGNKAARNGPTKLKETSDLEVSFTAAGQYRLVFLLGV